jgi:hypothetical protein
MERMRAEGRLRPDRPGLLHDLERRRPPGPNVGKPVTPLKDANDIKELAKLESS